MKRSRSVLVLYVHIRPGLVQGFNDGRIVARRKVEQPVKVDFVGWVHRSYYSL